MKTTKLDLAAALISLGAGLGKIDKTDPRHMEFHLTYSAPFADEDDWFYNRKREWDGRTLQVNARTFSDTLQMLKSEVHKTY